jgi:hypothetical protein
MLGIDERRRAPIRLSGGDDRQGQRGLARGFRPENLDHATARNTADAERNVEAQRAGRNGFDFVGRARVAEPHHRAFSELFFDLAQRSCESFLTILFHGESSTKCDAIISYSAPHARLIST